jgi:hypothetical protein
MTFSGTISSDFLKLAGIPLERRPNLVDFAATDFLSLRTSMIDYVKAVYPDEYKYFIESDLGMMFIELTAYMGAVMSMKADMLANENFLSTAKQRKSVKKLLELIGIRMRGPLSSAADAKLTFTDPFPNSPPSSPDNIQILPGDRVVQTTSPEDGAALTFTLYKVVNGLVDTANNTGIITLDPQTESSNSSGDRNVFENLVIQEGTLVTDEGEFAATEGVKTVKLTQGPVVEGSIQVFVNSNESNANGAFTEVDNIYFASGSADRIFEVAYDDTYAATIVFGDGSVGVSPDDTASYFVSYRVGGGSRGNIIKDALNINVRGYDPVSEVFYDGTMTNTSKGTGGTNAETIDHAKKYAPLKFRSQDRLVTLDDYSTFANTFISTWGTVGRATAATRNAYSSANTIDIYVLEKANDLQLQRATSNFKTQLLAAIEPKKMATDDVVIVDGLIRTLDLVTTIRIDREQEENQEQIKAKVRDKILNFMNIDNLGFGQDVVVADLNRQIFEVEEVRFSTLDNVPQDIRVDFNEIVQVNNVTINVEYLD